MTLHTFQTDNLGLAAKLFAVIQSHHKGDEAPPAPLPTAAAAPPPPPPPAPPTAAAPPPPPPPAAAAPPPPPPPPAAPAAAPANIDPALMVPPAGWLIDHIKSAAQAFTAKHGTGGAAKLAEACARYCPPGTAKPSITKVLPAYWADLHRDLSAG